MRLHINHKTHYSYDQPVPYALQQVRLTPKSGHCQTVDNWKIEIEGGRIECTFEDHHCNVVHLIRQAIVYETDRTDSGTTAEEALRAGHGVCQDHAHAFVSAARLLDYPARYVSGYLMMDDRVYQEASHAWAEAYVPDLGWVGFDVSNVISPDERYARIATGLDYDEAAPISGIVFGDSEESMLVSLQVQQ